MNGAAGLEALTSESKGCHSQGTGSMTWNVMAVLSPEAEGQHGGCVTLTNPVISPSTDTMMCYKGTMLRLGVGFAKEAVQWSVLVTQVCEPEETCQETLLLVDIGVWDEMEDCTPAWGHCPYVWAVLSLCLVLLGGDVPVARSSEMIEVVKQPKGP